MPEGHRYTAVFLVGHARTLAAMRRFPVAEQEMFEAHEKLVAAWGRDHKRAVACVENFVTLYDAWHAAEPGKGYDAKAAEWL